MQNHQLSHNFKKGFWLLCFVFFGLSTSMLHAQISGTVFRDFNSNGLRDNANELGVQGISVTVFNATGQVGQTTTLASGDYSVTPSATGPFRVEFGNLPTGYFPSFRGNDNGTLVRFLDAGSHSNVNFAVNIPQDYCQADPLVVTPCYTNGDPLDATVADNVEAGLTTVLVGMDYSGNAGDLTQDVPIAQGSELGSTWGLAYQRTSDNLFAAAVQKRHVGFGPLGTGGIYRVQNPAGTSTVTPFIDVKTIGINTGNDPHTGLTGDKTVASQDLNSIDAVGKIGIGDIDISEDEQDLFITNLNDRRLYRIRVNNPPTTPTAASVTGYNIPNPGCISDGNRPWAVKYYRGRVYVGVVCTAPNDLKATVYQFDPNVAGGNPQQVLSFPLSFTRGFAASGCATDNRWYPWTTTNALPAPCYTFNFPDPVQVVAYAQPIFSDIEFDVNGEMVLGFVDRTGFQTGLQNDDGNGNLVTGVSGGDIYRATRSGANWVIEGTAGDGLTRDLNNQGPNGGEFYHGDAMFYQIHEESAWGGLALKPGSDEVAVVALDGSDSFVWAGSMAFLSNSTGDWVRGYNFYENAVPGDLSGTSGKAVGLGDVELLCAPAPLEIGNRVWNDLDTDGIQDANEVGIANVAVALWKNGVQVGSTVTAADGTYYFNNSNVTGGLLPNMAYEIRVNAPTGFTATVANANNNNSDQIDSDATPSGTTSVINVTTGNFGQNNHSYDFGFGAAIYDLALINELAPNQSATVNPGDNVAFKLTIKNQGNVNSGNFTVVNQLPAGTTFVSAVPMDSATTTCGTPNASGLLTCNFVGNLVPNAVTMITITATINAGSTNLRPYRNWAEISVDSGDDRDSTPDTNTGLDNVAGEGTPPNDAVVNHNNIDDNRPRTEDEDDNDFEQVDVAARYDLALIKTLAPAQTTPVAPGATIDYVITVKNQGNVPSGTFTVGDRIPSGLGFVSASGTNFTCSAPVNRLLSCAFGGSLAANATATINLRLRLDDVSQAPFRNWAEITQSSGTDTDSTPDSNMGDDNGSGTGVNGNDPTTNHNNIDSMLPQTTDEDDSDYEDVTPLIRYDLALINTLAPGQSATVQPNDVVNFKLTIKNQGNVNSGNFTVLNEIPGGMTFVSATPMSNNITCTEAQRLVTCNFVGNLAPNESTMITIAARVTDLSLAPYRNNAEIAVDSGDDIDSTPDVNIGNDNAAGTGTPANDPVVNHNNIDDNRPRTEDEDDQDFEDVAVQVRYDLTLINTLAPGQSATVQPGATVDFKLTIKNQGNVPSGNFTVQDRIPAGATYANWASMTGNTTCTHNAGLVTCNFVGNLAPNEVEMITIQVVAPTTATGIANQPFRNNAEITVDSGDDADSTPDTNIGNDNGVGTGIAANDPTVNHNNIDYTGTGDEDDQDYEDFNVQVRYDLALIKRLANGQASSVGTGGTVNYVITVKNAGNVPSGSFTVTDRIPTGMSFVSAGTGCTHNAGVVTCVNNTGINPLATVDIPLTLRVDDVSQAPFANWAEISADSGDDVDSTPDLNTGNDNGPGTGNPPNDLVNDTDDIDYTGNDDEDDNDFEQITALTRYDLALIKTVQNATIMPNGTANFSLIVKNQGDVPSGTFTVTDQLPAGLTYQSATGAGFTCSNSGQTVNCVYTGSLAPNATAQIALSATVSDVSLAPYRNWAEISADSGDDADSTPDTNTGNDNGTGLGNPPNDLYNNTDNIDYTGNDDEDDNDYGDVMLAVRYDLSLIKTRVGSGAVRRGDVVNYVISVKNQGNVPSGVFTVTDQIPVGMTFQSASGSGFTCGNAGQTVTCNFTSTLAAGATTNLNLAVVVGDLSQAPYRNWAEISADSGDDADSTTDTNTGNDNGSGVGNPPNDLVNNHNQIDYMGNDDEDDNDYEEVQQAIADLALDKSVNQNVVEVGDEITYTITVTNQGPSDATGVTVRDQLPAQLQFVSSVPAGVYANNIWTIGNLANGATTTLQIRARVITELPTIVNYAEIATQNESDIDSTPGNNSTNEDDDDDVPITVVPKLDLELDKATSATLVKVGDIITFTLSVTNTSARTGTNVSVEDVLPAGLTFISASDQTYNPSAGDYIWNIGTMTAGQTRTLTMQVRVDRAGNIVNYAQIQSTNEDDTDSTPGNGSMNEDDDDKVEIISENTSPNLTITKVVDRHVANVGDLVTYTITVRNDGNAAANSVELRDPAANQLSNVSYSVNGGASTPFPSSGVVNLGTVAPNQTLIITIRGTIPASAAGKIIENVATVYSPNNPPVPPTPPVQTCVGVPRLQIAKSVNRTYANIGDEIIYTLTVSNDGNAPATTVHLVDTNANALLNPTYTVSGDASGSGSWTGTLTLTPNGGLAPGETITVLIRGTVPANRQGTVIRNVAQVSSPQDPNPPVVSPPVETVIGLADLDIRKSVDKAVAQVGELLTYTIEVTNNGNGPANQVTINDTNPVAYLLNPTYTLTGDASGSGNWTGSLVVNPNGGLQQGETLTLIIRGTIPQTAQGTVIPNVATASSPNDPTAPVTTPPVYTHVGTPNLVPVKTVNRTVASVGDELVYTITVTNAGTGVAQTLTLTDVEALVLTNPTYVLGGDASGSGIWTGTLLVSPVGGLASGENVTLTIRGTVPQSRQNSIIRNTVQVSSPQDPQGPKTPPPVETIIGAPSLTIQKSVNRAVANEGDTLVYTIVIGNNGNGTANVLNVTDGNVLTLNNPTYVMTGDATGAGTWTGGLNISPNGGLAPGETITITISGVVPVGRRGTIIPNTATVNSPQDPQGPKTTPPVETVIGAAKLEIVKFVDKALASVGETLNYTLVVRNTGTAPATSITVDDAAVLVLENRTYIVTGAVPGGGVWNGTWTGTPAGGSLAPGGTLTINITGTIPQGFQNSQIVNVGRVSSPQDPTGPNVSPPVTTNIIAPRIGLAKRLISLTDTGNRRYEAEFLFTIRNYGNLTLYNVGLTDNMAATFGADFIGVIGTPVSVSGNFTVNPSYNGTSNIQLLGSGNTLAVDQSEQVRVRVAFQAPNAVRTYYNTATTRGTTSGGTTVTDDSDDGTTPDGNGNGNPTDDSDPTPVPVTPKQADLAITKTASALSPQAGDLVRFTLTVRNLGPDTAENVHVTDVLPLGLSYFAQVATQGTYNVGNGIWTVGNLANGASASLTITTTINSNAGDYLKNVATTTSDTPDPSSPNNMDMVVLTPTGCSSGHEGGVESTGSSVSVLNGFETFYQAKFNKDLGEGLQTQNILAARANARFENRFLSAEGPVAKVEAAKTSASRLATLVPTVGPQGANGIEATPSWIVSPTNASEVYGQDYVYATNNQRVASVLAIASGTALYDHTKTTCDRLGGSSLESIETVSIEGYPFLVSKLHNEGNSMDYAISFVAYKVGENYVIDSRFSNPEYVIPSGVQEVLNFQVWGAAPQFAAKITQDILNKLKGGSTINYLNSALTAPKVYVRKGVLENGQLRLTIRNEAQAEVLSLVGTTATTETAAQRNIRTWSIAINPNLTEQDILVEVGNGFDMQFRMGNNKTLDQDELYFAEGAWGYNLNGGTLANFNTTATVSPNGQLLYGVHRGASISGQTAGGNNQNNWMSLFRYFRAGNGVLDLKAEQQVRQQVLPFNVFAFNATGNGVYKVVLGKKGNTDWANQYAATFTLNGSRRVRMDLRQFKTETSQLPLVVESQLSDLELVAFYPVFGSADAGTFTLSVKDLAFEINPTINTEAEELPREVSLSTNYPNPFSQHTNIEYALPQSANVQLEVFDVLGRRVATLVSGTKEAGKHEAIFDASQVASGTYFYRLQVGDKVLSKSMVVLR